MLGYMTKKEAIENGFTHHGKYHFIPLYMTDEDTPMVATKFMPLELFVTAFHVIEGFMAELAGVDYYYQFLIGSKLEKDNE